ncbi:MAG: isoaspartyl peptidase/L-asparaginase family protein [Terriglobales bacterium]
MSQKAEPIILIHGGCGRVDAATHAERRSGVQEAATAGWAVLEQGGTALDAVTAAVERLEDLPQFNAGRGSVLNADGEIETDASIMDGSSLAAGAVACVRGLLHPVRLARRVMEASPHVLLCGEGAVRFAAAQGFTFCAPGELVVPGRRQDWENEHGTVGAVACDAQGRLAAATSTGGMTGKLPGRVGDTPLIGCGTYADRHLAVSCTGHGEQIIRMTLARLAAFRYAGGGDAQAAAQAALDELARNAPGDAGLILVDHRGRIAYAFNTSQMPVCAINPQGMTLPS